MSTSFVQTEAQPHVDAARLRTTWFPGWSPILDQALAELPEMPTCPHELYRELAQNPTRVTKRHALVTEAGQPVCLVSLRRRDRHWHVVTDGGVAPRNIAPAKPGYLYPSLARLGVDLWVQSVEERPPPRWTSSLTPYPFYRISLKGDFEGYWRESRNRKAVRFARNHFIDRFDFEIDQPGAADWIIGSWENKWGNTSYSQASAAADMLVAARYFQHRNRLHTFRLLHKGEPVAGHTFLLLANNVLLLGATHRLPEHNGAGTRLYDLAFHWAAEAGFDNLDMGSGHAYKERWAPLAGVRWTFNIAPWYLRTAKRLAAYRRPISRAFLRNARPEADQRDD